MVEDVVEVSASQMVESVEVVVGTYSVVVTGGKVGRGLVVVVEEVVVVVLVKKFKTLSKSRLGEDAVVDSKAFVVVGMGVVVTTVLEMKSVVVLIIF